MKVSRNNLRKVSRKTSVIKGIMSEYKDYDGATAFKVRTKSSLSPNLKSTAIDLRNPFDIRKKKLVKINPKSRHISEI